jgi:hypothetical protein
MAGLTLDGRTPLAKFTLFSKLPAELHIKIWEHALPTEMDPNGRLMLCIFGDLDGVSLLFALELLATFFLPHGGARKVATSLQCLDTSLLLASKESPAVYLETFKYCLQYTYDDSNVIRFCNSITIYIYNFWHMLSDIERAIKLHQQLPDYFTYLKRLAIDYVEFWHPIIPRTMRERSLALVQLSFKNLELLSMWTDDRKFSNKTVEPTISRLREALKVHKKDVDPDYNVPVIEIIE